MTSRKPAFHPKILCRMPFLPHSPNLPELETNQHYAGLHTAELGCLFEMKISPLRIMGIMG